MSFLDIKDPEERDATIEDHLALKIKERNLEELGDLIDPRRELEETFEPAVASNVKFQLILTTLNFYGVFGPL